MKPKRSETKAARLSKTYGGKWTYDNICTWHCDDGKRYVVRTAPCPQENGERYGPPDYILYGDGPPRNVLLDWFNN